MPIRVKSAALATCVLFGACGGGVQEDASPEYDLILRGGTIVDGSGLDRYRGDVAIAGRHIVAAGDLGGRRARAVIDVTGLFVAPGFINLHSHAQPDGLPSAENMLTQGVTTEIINADGAGPLDIAAQLDSLTAVGLAVNVGADIGFNSVWVATVGMEDRRPGVSEIEAMGAALEAGLEAGAWGVSAGLDYKPAYFARVEEVVRVLAPARVWRTNFTNHDRLTPESNFSSRVGIAETLTIGERAGLMPIVTHMKVQGREQGAAPAILASMQRVTEEGTYAAADAYPYLAGQTSLAALIIPGWAQEGGQDAMQARFRDPALRARIVADADAAMAARFGGPAGVYMPETETELVDAMREFGVESGGEAVVRILEEDGRRGAILRFGSESDLIAILQHPTTSIACDCGAAAGQVGHPRYWGSFPRVLGHYVRETGALTWEDAIRKMTGLPATTIGMVDRGFIAPGMVADVVVFDPATVIDHATYQQQTLKSDGIVHVWVGGEQALRDGAVTGAQGGRALRRSRRMPSRPMSTRGTRSLTIADAPGAPVEGAWDIALEVTHHAGDPLAGGIFRFVDPTSGQEVVATALGRVQTATGWASFTGMVRVASEGLDVPVVVLVDAPPGATSSATISIEMEGRPPISGTLTRDVQITAPQP